jgi:site-specific DNA recombinase
MGYQEKHQEKNDFEGRLGLVYARVSSKRQEVEGSGLQSQEGRCKDFLETVGVPYLKTFPDSFSGGGDFINRPAMKELLKYIDQNRHKRFVVVFDDLKRFARDVEFHLKLRTAFKSRNVLLKCLNYNFDDSSEGRFIEVILAAGAELERHQNKRQVIQKMKARLEAGYWTFGSKRGYSMVADPIHGKISEPLKIEGKLLKNAFEGFANGAFVRVFDACKYLVENGFWSQKPDRYAEKLTLIFKDPFYAGFIEYPAWDVERRIGRHEAIVSLETFNIVQARLDKGSLSKKIRVDTSEEFCFRGLIICAACQGHLTGAYAKGRSKRYAYYYCQNMSCMMFRTTFKKEDVEQDFQALLKSQYLKPETVYILNYAFEKICEEEEVNLDKNKQALEKQKEDLMGKLNRLSELAGLTKSHLVRKAYEKQIEDAATTLEKIEEQQAKKTSTLISYRTAWDKALVLLQNPYKYWSNVDVLEKHKLFFFIFDSKLPYSKIRGYRTDKIPSAIRLFEEFATANPHDVDMPSKILNPIKIYLDKFQIYYESSHLYKKSNYS